MTDQEMITDFISSEKKMSANYDIFASECVSIPLRDEFLKLFNRSHQTQTELFQTAQSKGWYQPEQAPENKISQAYQKYSSQQPT
ncbi:MAG: spore coat protein [Oscillospiraceae bacterium]|nr:spore coat protein [Oscillospiraceae bacterium]